MTWRRLLSSSWPAMIAALVTTAFILVRTGVSMLSLGTFAVYLGLGVALPGVFAWRLLTSHFHTRPNPASVRNEPPPTWFEDLSLGTVFGFGVQLPVYLVGVWINVPLMFLILPVTVVIVSTSTAFGRRAWTMPRAKVGARLSWALAAIVVFAVAFLARRIFVLRPLALPLYKTPSVDETFHQALISELSHRFPPEIPFLLGTRLDYHWFVHAQMAADHWATQLSTQLLLRELMPTAMIALTVSGLGAVALRLSGRPLAAAIAPALLVAGGFSLAGPHYDAGNFAEAYMSRRFVSSPSQAYGFMMALPAIALILEVLRPDRKPSRLSWIALTLSLLALSGSKATFMPIFLCGAIGLWLVQLVFRRTFDRRVASLAGLLLAVTIFAQVVLFGGSSGALALDPFLTVQQALRAQQLAVTPVSTVVMAGTLLIAWLLYGVGALGLCRRGLWRDPRCIWMLFGVPAGVAVGLLFFRSGLSQLWFQRSVAELVVLLSAWGLVQLLPNPLTKRDALPLATVAAGAGLAAFVISSAFESGKQSVSNATYPEIVATVLAPPVIVAGYVVTRVVRRRVTGRFQPGPTVLLVCLLGLGLSRVFSLGWDTVTQRSVSYPTPSNQFAPGGIPAAEWIANHSDRYDIVATNMHGRKPNDPRCDNRNFWLAAYTERRIVVEGWGYTEQTNEANAEGGCRQVPPPAALAVNDEAFRHPSPITLRGLVDGYDVKYLFVSKRYPADIPGLRRLHAIVSMKFHDDNYVVFKVLHR